LTPLLLYSALSNEPISCNESYIPCLEIFNLVAEPMYIFSSCVSLFYSYFILQRLTLLFEDRIGSVMEEVIHL
jgi:hypothetical protein